MIQRAVIIIGAGIGGLSAAIHLAQAGYAVTVLEKNARVGGQIQAYSAAGFRWETGPVALSDLSLLRQPFEAAGRRLEDTLRPLRFDPVMRAFYPDGTVFDLRRDLSELVSEIARLDERDVEGFLRFLAFAARMYSVKTHASYGDSGQRPGAGLWASRQHRAPNLAARTLSDAIDSTVESQALRQALRHFATLAGGDPGEMPSSYSAIAHQVLSGGSVYVRGGISAYVDALRKLAIELGVRIRTSSPVTEITLERGVASGVKLAANDERLAADAVVSNVDALATARYLLPEDSLPPVLMNRLRRAPPSASAFVLLLGVRGVFPQLAHHNVFFSADSGREAEQLFSQGAYPDDPTITVSISSKTAPHHAPPQQENWRVQVAAPPLSERVAWLSQQDAYRNRILEILAHRYGLDLADRLRVERRLTPADFQAMTGAWRGALYGISPNTAGAGQAEPRLRSERFKRLYFVGGTVLPGGGVAEALLSAGALVDVLRRDLA